MKEDKTKEKERGKEIDNAMDLLGKKSEEKKRKKKEPEKQVKEKNDELIENKKEETAGSKFSQKRDNEIEKAIRLLTKDEEKIKKDGLTEKVNTLVEDTERELGKISFMGKKTENKKTEKKGLFSFLKKPKKNQDN